MSMVSEMDDSRLTCCGHEVEQVSWMTRGYDVEVDGRVDEKDVEWMPSR